MRCIDQSYKILNVITGIVAYVIHDPYRHPELCMEFLTSMCLFDFEVQHHSVEGILQHVLPMNCILGGFFTVLCFPNLDFN